MQNPTDSKNDKAVRDAETKARVRAEQASIVNGLQTILEGDEQLMAFSRGHIGGGWRGKFIVGPEAFFAPIVNIGLTERRIVLQHIRRESGKPGNILPHSFPLAEIASITLSDVETYGQERAGRLVIRLIAGDQTLRLRLNGDRDFTGAEQITRVFQSLTSAHRNAPSPMQDVCPFCGHRLDQTPRFCPYCGARLEEAKSAPAANAPSAPPAPEPPIVDPGPIGAEPPVAEPVPPHAVAEPAPPPEPPIAAEPAPPVAAVEPTAPEPPIAAAEPAPPPESTAAVAEPVAASDEDNRETETIPGTDVNAAPAYDAEEWNPTESPAYTSVIDFSPAPEAVSAPSESAGEESEPAETPQSAPVAESPADTEPYTSGWPGELPEPAPAAAQAPDVSPSVDMQVPFVSPEDFAHPVSRPAVASDFADAAEFVISEPDGLDPAIESPEEAEPEAPTDMPMPGEPASRPAEEPAARRGDGPMRVVVHIDVPQMTMNEIFVGANGEDVVRKMKERIARELQFSDRVLIGSLGPLTFAQEAVHRYNQMEKTNMAKPESCYEFLEMFESVGYATIERI